MWPSAGPNRTAPQAVGARRLRSSSGRGWTCRGPGLGLARPPPVPEYCVPAPSLLGLRSRSRQREHPFPLRRSRHRARCSPGPYAGVVTPLLPARPGRHRASIARAVSAQTAAWPPKCASGGRSEARSCSPIGARGQVRAPGRYSGAKLERIEVSHGSATRGGAAAFSTGVFRPSLARPASSSTVGRPSPEPRSRAWSASECNEHLGPGRADSSATAARALPAMGRR